MPAMSNATASQPAHDIRSRRTKRHQRAKSRMHVPMATGITRDVIPSGYAALVAAKKHICPSATTAAQATETFQTRPGFQIRFAAHAIVQMIAMGDLKDLNEARELMGVSDPPVAYEPNRADADAWAEALERFKSLKSQVAGRK